MITIVFQVCFHFMLVLLWIHCECAARAAAVAAAAAIYTASSSSSSLSSSSPSSSILLSSSSTSSASSPAPAVVHSQALGFELIHRDAPGSVIRGPETDCTDLPESMPLRDFVAAGRGVRSRQPQPSIVGGQVSYEGQRQGDFYLTMAVGSPAQRLVFLMDTGSELVWAQCKPCEVCIDTGSAPSFTVARSSTYKRLSCTSALCHDSLGFSGAGCGLDANASSPSSSSSSPTSSSQSASSTPPSSSDSSSCSFRIHYADGSGNEGFLSVDVFHLAPLKKLAGRLIFGCSVRTIDTVSGQSVKGLMGLSAGPFSFPSQLKTLFSGRATKWPHKFAYCLPDRRNLARRGTILFGNYSLPAAVSQAMRYTPFLSPFAPLGKLYYYVGLRAISVGKSVLPIHSSVLLPDSDGGGGTILDSGSSLTSLFTPAYKPLIKALRRATLHLRPVSVEGTGLCYNSSASSHEPPAIPTITFHFLGGVDLEIPPHSALVAESVSRDRKFLTVCTAFVDAGPYSPDDTNIIGNYQQQNYWIEHDLENSRVGFAKSTCLSP